MKYYSVVDYGLCWLIVTSLVALCQGLSVSTQEYASLQDLYSNTNGPMWIWRNSTRDGPIWFNVSVDPCLPKSWQGLECTCTTDVPVRCAVSAFDLEYYNMSGALPQSVSGFLNLTLMDFAENNLYGTIPASIGSMPLLNRLVLTNNSFTGTIPKALFSLTQLKFFAVDYNKLTGTLPPEIRLWRELDSFYVNGNFFHGTLPDEVWSLPKILFIDAHRSGINGTISPAIANARQLNLLDLSLNSLTGTIPPEIGQLTNLLFLHWESNYLNGTIPEELYNCSALSEIYLYNNLLTGTISPNVARLPRLRNLFLSINPFHGTLPEALCDVERLHILYANNMNLTGSIPGCLWDMPRLSGLQLFQNQLTGTLPEVFGNLSSIDTIEIQDNMLWGSIPASIGNLTTLTVIELGYNFLTGTIPDTIANLDRLIGLDLNDNYIRGSIPQVMYEMHSLREFQASFNLMTGSISEDIGHMRHLITLELSDNLINGSIPSSLGNLERLGKLDLDNNYLTGSIPETLYNARNLTYLDTLIFSFNYITSSLPSSLGSLRYMVSLAGGDNLLTGRIPESVCGYSQLFTQFFVEQNMLSGPIPECLFKTLSVQEVALYSNAFTGGIPYNYTNEKLYDILLYDNALTGPLPQFTSSAVQYFEVYQNDFTGTLPRGLFAVGAYTELALDTNLLTGTIPETIDDVINVNYISLYNNVLSGTIPKLFKLTALTVFYIDNNLLEGPIECFNATKQRFLNSLDLSNNRFTGTLPEVLFQLPSISAVAIVQNCFVGTIPESICGAEGLTALALDGLHSAGTCRYNLFNKNYALKYHTPGTIPPCIFNMPQLHTVHISGNGLGGSLPYNLSVGPNLVDVALSYNQLTGLIPYELQEKATFNFDLSFNNFNGILLPFAKPLPLNGSVYLRVNRLSGKIPPLLKHMDNISILDSNMFECQMDRSQLPDNDPQSYYYECATSSLQHSIYVFIFFLCLWTVVLGGLFLCRERLKQSGNAAAAFVMQLYRNAQNYWTTMTQNLEEYPNIALLNKFINNLRWCIVALTAVVTVVLMPMYIGLSQTYSVYQYKYAWNLSSVYLSGFTPAVTLFVFYILFIVFTFVCIYAVAREFHVVDVHKSSKKSMVERMQLRYKHYVGMVGIAIFNFIFVLGVNIGYVLISTELAPEALTFVQLMLASFKLVWNDYVVKKLTRNLHKYCTRDVSLSLAEERIWNNRYLSFNTYTLLFNIIIIPCIATAAVSSVCLYNTFISPLNVVSTLTYEQCVEFNTVPNLSEIRSNCSTYGQVTVTTTYLPPYIYRYQCASTLVTTYAIVYVYKYVLAAFFQPLFMMYLVRVYETMNPQWKLFRVVKKFVPRLKHRTEIGKKNKSYILQPDRFNLRMIMYLAVFVTFGVIFPPIGFMVCVTVLTQTYQIQLLVGRLLYKSDERPTLLAFLNHDAANAGVMFKNTAYVIGGPAAFFYAFFLFDTYGDAVGGRGALWMSLTMFVVGCGCVAVYRYKVGQTRREDEEGLLEARDTKIELSLRPSMRLSAMSVKADGESEVVAVPVPSTVGGGEMPSFQDSEAGVSVNPVHSNSAYDP